MRITRDVAKELLPIIQAFAEGKNIQDKIDGITDWVDTEEINLEFEGQKILHRIKPQPKCRPFKNQEECWGEMHNHRDFGWVINKQNGAHFNISPLFTDSCEEGKIMVYQPYNLAEAFANFTFTDGAPFGLVELVEE